MKLGNGRYEAHEYRTPGTPTVYKLGIAVGDGSLTRIEYDFHPATNNGNVWKQRIIRPQFSAEQEYGYDALNRISGMYESAAVNRAYDYDRYGNRYVETSSSQIPSPIAPEPTMPGHFNAANNRLAMTGTGFDAAGNQTTLAPYTLEYDAEGRNTVVKLSGVSYATFSYDGEGRRVRKAMNGGDTTYYLYDALGQMAVEYSTEPPSSSGSSYLFTDMLGSVRTITNDVGAVVECYDYLPFGRMLGSGVGGRGSCYPDPPDANYDSRAPQKFTGKERDAETGLDYFEARYYSGAQGRFLSVDPENAGAKRDDPQSWNAYAYSRNNPLKYVDPDGRLYEVVWDQENFHATYELSDWGFGAYSNRLSGLYLFDHGVIYYRQSGQKVGTYRQIIDDRLLAIKQAGELASPAANILTEAMKIFGWIAAPEAMAIAEYASGEDRSEVSLALAVIPGGKIAKSGGKAAVKFSEDAAALIELAKEAKRKGNLSREEAKTLIQWAKEYGVTGRGPEMHVKRIFNKLHIHIGPVDHINVLPK